MRQGFLKSSMIEKYIFIVELLFDERSAQHRAVSANAVYIQTTDIIAQVNADAVAVKIVLTGLLAHAIDQYKRIIGAVVQFKVQRMCHRVRIKLAQVVLVNIGNTQNTVWR